jgi:hypothetical protein
MGVTNTNAYDGPFYPNGVTTSFPFTFRTMSTSEVQIVNEDGDVIVGFSFSIVPATNADGGSIVFDAPPSAAELPVFLIASVPDFGVGIDLGSVTAFNPRTLNPSFERLAVQNIFLKSQGNRAMQAPFGEEGILNLPSVAARSGKVMSFDAGGGVTMVDVDFANRMVTDDGEWTPDDPLLTGDPFDWFSTERIDPGKFGIVNSAIIDQTAAMLRLAAFVNGLPRGAAIHWGHRTVIVTQPIIFTQSVSFVGEGMGLSRLICIGSTAQVKVMLGAGSDDDYEGCTVEVRGMRFMSGGLSPVSPLVVDITANTGGVAIGAVVRDCFFSGTDPQSGFKWAAEFLGCSNVTLDNVVVVGARGIVPPPGQGAFLVDAKTGQTKADLLVNRMLVTFVPVALQIRGSIEGIKVFNSTVIVCRRGIDWQADAGAAEPSLVAIGNHFNCEEKGIWTIGIVQYTISGNLFYNQGGGWNVANFVAIDTKATEQPLVATIFGNQVFLLDGAAPVRTAIAVRGTAGNPLATSNVSIDLNSVYGGGAGTTVGIYLDPYTVATLLGFCNDIRGCSTEVINESSSNSIRHTTSSGKIGIGTVDPDEQLHVVGAIKASGSVIVGNVIEMPGGVVIAEGSASPEGAFAAPPASLFLTPGATYRKGSGTGTTGWVSIG